MSPGTRQYRPVLSRFAAVVSIGVAACLPAVGATAQWYVGIGIGGNASREVVMKSLSNDRASICDEHHQPEGALCGQLHHGGPRRGRRLARAV